MDKIPFRDATELTAGLNKKKSGLDNWKFTAMIPEPFQQMNVLLP